MLTQFQDNDRTFQLMQNSWAAQINPLLSNPLNQCSLLTGIVLAVGTNTINHKLGRKLQGWFIVGQNALASIYDSQASNQSPDLTLVLVSNAIVTISLAVF